MVAVAETLDPLLQIDIQSDHLLLHAILCNDQVLFKGMKNILSNCKSTTWTFEVPGKYEIMEGGLCPYTTSKGVMQVALW
jgi:hypothetical protein